MAKTVQFPADTSAFVANKTISALNGQSLFDNKGATGTVAFGLPPALVGKEYTFYVSAAQAVNVDPNGTEKISLTTGVNGVAGKYLGCATAEAYLHIACIEPGEWKVLDSRGVWVAEA